jgi:hypothetical protein
MRYTITMASETDPMVMANGRTVRLVRFQNADGTYPANAHEVTSSTMATLYSTSSADRRGYIGSFPVGSLPAIHNEIDARQKAAAWMNPSPADIDTAIAEEQADACDIGGYVDELCDEHHAQVTADRTPDSTPTPMPIGERDPVNTTAGNDDHGDLRTWRRTINGKHYSFNVVNMPDGELRLFASVYNGYGDKDVQLFGMTQAEADERGMQWGCAWDRVHAITIKSPATMTYEETKAAQLAYLRSIPGRMPTTCETYECNDVPTVVVTLGSGNARSETRHCDRHGFDLQESAFFQNIRSISPLVTPKPIPAVAKPPFTPDAAEERLVASCLKSQALADEETNARALAAKLHKRAGSWAAEHCHHVPPLAGCWCAILGTPIPVPTVTRDAPGLAPRCQGSQLSLCTAASTAYLACCGAPMCSHHAAETITEACPVCGSVMSAPLAAFDAASEAQGSPAYRPILSGRDIRDESPITSTLTVDSRREPSGPRYGVSVEWWDDRAVRAVIGSYETWETAAHEVERLKRLERFEFVHGIVALYASEGDI